MDIALPVILSYRMEGPPRIIVMWITRNWSFVWRTSSSMMSNIGWVPALAELIPILTTSWPSEVKGSMVVDARSVGTRWAKSPPRRRRHHKTFRWSQVGRLCRGDIRKRMIHRSSFLCGSTKISPSTRACSRDSCQSQLDISYNHDNGVSENPKDLESVRWDSDYILPSWGEGDATLAWRPRFKRAKDVRVSIQRWCPHLNTRWPSRHYAEDDLRVTMQKTTFVSQYKRWCSRRNIKDKRVYMNESCVLSSRAKNIQQYTGKGNGQVNHTLMTNSEFR